MPTETTEMCTCSSSKKGPHLNEADQWAGTALVVAAVLLLLLVVDALVRWRNRRRRGL